MDKQSLALSKAYTDKSILGISGALAGKNCTIKSVVGNVVTFEWTADDGTKNTTTMTVSASVPQEQIEEEVADWLDTHKEEVKGEGVQILSETETVADIKDSTVLAFSLAEDTTTEDAYTKTQSDVRFAKTYEVGDASTIVVTDATSLVNAINRTWLAGMSSMVFDATTKALNIVTRSGQTVAIDVSQIILSTSITEFKDMLITNVLDGQSIVWNSSKQKWINKSIDSSGVLTEAKQYTDTEIAKINNKGSIACDEKPTYYGGVITYKKGGVEKQTENVGTWFYYFDENGKAVQTIFVEGTEFTIAMAGDINLDDYVAKTSVINAYDEAFTDKTKVPNTQYMCDFKEAIDEELAEKVNTDDVTDTMGSAESPVSEDKIPNIKALKELHDAINDTVFKKSNVIASTDTTTSASDSNVYSAKKIDAELSKVELQDIQKIRDMKISDRFSWVHDIFDEDSTEDNKHFYRVARDNTNNCLVYQEWKDGDWASQKSFGHAIDDTTSSGNSVYSSGKVIAELAKYQKSTDEGRLKDDDGTSTIKSLDTEVVRNQLASRRHWAISYFGSNSLSPDGANKGDYWGVTLDNNANYLCVLVTSPRLDGRVFKGTWWDGVFQGWKELVSKDNGMTPQGEYAKYGRFGVSDGSAFFTITPLDQTDVDYYILDFWTTGTNKNKITLSKVKNNVRTAIFNN